MTARAPQRRYGWPPRRVHWPSIGSDVDLSEITPEPVGDNALRIALGIPYENSLNGLAEFARTVVNDPATYLGVIHELQVHDRCWAVLNIAVGDRPSVRRTDVTLVLTPLD